VWHFQWDSSSYARYESTTRWSRSAASTWQTLVAANEGIGVEMTGANDRVQRDLRIRAVILPFGLSLAFSFSGVARADDLPSAKEVWEGVVKNYAECLNYSDTGTIVNVTPGRDGQYVTDVAKFKTAFKRPSNLRFEYKSNEQTMLLHMEGVEIQRWWSGNQKMEEFRAIQDAVSTLTPATDLSARLTCGLLLPGVSEMPIMDNWEDAQVSRTALRGHDCYAIIGSRRSSKIKIFIRANDLLILQFQLERGDRLKRIISYHPVINEPIKNDDLVFWPSSSKEED